MTTTRSWGGRWLLVVAGALALGGFFAARARGQSAPPPASAQPAQPASQPSWLIFPPQSLPLAFDHARHMKLGARCESCHQNATTSTSAGDDLMPGEAACRACHEIDRTQPFKEARAEARPEARAKPPARCDACHTGWSPTAAQAEPPRVVVPRPNLKFNHQLHASRGFGCELCHAGAATGALATRADLPMMSLCLGCHTGGAEGAKSSGKRPTARCGACHLTLPDGRLKVNLASGGGPVASAAAGKLVPSGLLRGFDAHTPAFTTNHKAAGRDESYCLSCHRRSECLDCHNGTVRPLDIHPSDYVSLHGVDARRNTPDCSSCHRNQTFCVGCHQRTGVASDPSGGVPGQKVQNPFGTGSQVKSFHPPGWVRNSAGDLLGTPGPNSHSLQAKRNIRSCASCHREETCLACHSADPTRQANVDPHGVGFADSLKCRALASRNRRACLKCHTVSAPELDCR